MGQLWRSKAGDVAGVAGMDKMQARLGFVQIEWNMNKTESDCGAARPGRDTSFGEY